MFIYIGAPTRFNTPPLTHEQTMEYISTYNIPRQTAHMEYHNNAAPKYTVYKINI
jgi:hypothetical protein